MPSDVPWITPPHIGRLRSEPRTLQPSPSQGPSGGSAALSPTHSGADVRLYNAGAPHTRAQALHDVVVELPLNWSGPIGTR